MDEIKTGFDVTANQAAQSEPNLIMENKPTSQEYRLWAGLQDSSIYDLDRVVIGLIKEKQLTPWLADKLTDIDFWSSKEPSDEKQIIFCIRQILKASLPAEKVFAIRKKLLSLDFNDLVQKFGNNQSLTAHLVGDLVQLFSPITEPELRAKFLDTDMLVGVFNKSLHYIITNLIKALSPITELELRAKLLDPEFVIRMFGKDYFRMLAFIQTMSPVTEFELGALKNGISPEDLLSVMFEGPSVINLIKALSPITEPELRAKLLDTDFLEKGLGKHYYEKEKYITDLVIALSPITEPELRAKLLDPEFLIRVFGKGYRSELLDFVKLFHIREPEIAEPLLNSMLPSFLCEKNLVYFYNLCDMGIHRLIKNSDILASYGRFLLQKLFENLRADRGRLYHHIVEIQAMLENLGGEQFISQQNIILLREINTSQYETNDFSAGSMIATAIGNASANTIQIKEGNNEYSPHPNYVPGTVQGKPAYIIRNWQNIEPVTINKKQKHELPDGTKTYEITGSVNVRPIGVDSNFYSTYYEVINENEDNTIIQICLDMSTTTKLLKEFQEAFSNLDVHFDQLPGQMNSTEFINTMKSRNGEFEKLLNTSGVNTWKGLWQLLISPEADSLKTLYPIFYRTLVWHCRNEMILEDRTQRTVDRLSNDIRIMTSKDHGPYLNVCHVLETHKILSGNRKVNSHYLVFLKYIEAAKRKGIKKQKVNPYVRLFQPDTSSDFVDCKRQDVDLHKLSARANLTLKGENIEAYGQDLKNTINQHFVNGGKISINGSVLKGEEFENFVILPGDHIKLV